MTNVENPIKKGEANTTIKQIEEIAQSRAGLIHNILMPYSKLEDIEKSERETQMSLVRTGLDLEKQIARNYLELRDALWDIVFLTTGEAPLKKKGG